MTGGSPALPGPKLSTPKRLLIGGGIAVYLAATITVIIMSQTGPGTRLAVDVANPSHVVGGAAYANAPLFGVQNWPLVMQLSAISSALITYALALWVSFRQKRWHPSLVMLIISTVIALVADPIISWAAYTAYDPRMWHVPETWPLFNIVPTVEPLVLIPGYACFYVWCSIPGLWIHQKITARTGPNSWIRRRPLVALFLIGGFIAFCIDEAQAFMATRTETIIYTQIATGAWRSGTSWQSNMVWEPVLCFMLFGLCALSIYKYPNGDTLARRWSKNRKTFRHRPLMAEFAVMTAILVGGTMLYVAIFSVVRVSGAGTHVACPWPYENTKVYDPDGEYAKQCPESIQKQIEQNQPAKK